MLSCHWLIRTHDTRMQGSIFRRIRRIRRPDPAGSAPDLKLPDRLRVTASRLAAPGLAWPGTLNPKP